MDVQEHVAMFGEGSRCAFANEWFKLTGTVIPTAESVIIYWLRHGYTLQAG